MAPACTTGNDAVMSDKKWISRVDKAPIGSETKTHSKICLLEALFSIRIRFESVKESSVSHYYQIRESSYQDKSKNLRIMSEFEFWMNRDLTMQGLRSCALAVLLLLISSFASTSSTTQWNGKPCLAGTQYGFPLPFVYSARKSENYPSESPTPACTSRFHVSGAIINAFNVVLDYLVWFGVSIPIVLLSSWLLLDRPTSKLVEVDAFAGS